MDAVQLAAVLGTIVLVASVISVELGVTVALVELTLGVVAGNALGLHSQGWLDFVASFGFRLCLSKNAKICGRFLNAMVTWSPPATSMDSSVAPTPALRSL